MGSNAQQFCLKWNNHQANMLSVFDRLLSNKSLVDVTIGCEGRQVKAHKVVLSACSPFFENLFTENPCKHPIVILKDIRYADLKALVEFMYKGEVNVVQEQLPTLLKTAEALKIKGLAEVTGEGKSDDKPHASVTPRPESPGSRRKRQRVRRKSTDSAAGVSESEESVPKAGRTEHDDSSMDGATSLDDGSQASLQHPQTPSQASGQARGEKETSNVQSNAVTVNNSSSSAQANSGNSTTNGPNSSSKDADFEPTRLLEASMTTDHGADNSTDLNNSTGPENPLLPDGLDIKPIITLEEGATPTGGIVPASGATSLATGTDAISSLFPYPQGTGAAALPGTSHQASPQSHGIYSDCSGRSIQLPVSIWAEDAVATNAISSAIKIESIDASKVVQSSEHIGPVERPGTEFGATIDTNLWVPASATVTNLPSTRWQQPVVSIISTPVVVTATPVRAAKDQLHRQKAAKTNRRPPTTSRYSAASRRESIAQTNLGTLQERQPHPTIMSPPPVTSRTKKQQQQQQQQPPHHHQQQSGAVVLRHVRVQRVGSERRPAPKSHQPVASGHPTVVTMPQGSSQSVDLPHSAAITVVPTSMVTIHPTKMHQFSTDLIATGRQFQLNQPIITEAGEEFHVNPDSEEIGSLRTAPEYFLVDSGRVSPRQISSSSGNETSCSVSAQQSRILVEDQPCP